MDPVSGVMIVMLQVNEAAGRLNEAFEIVRVVRGRFEPDMLEHVMRFIVALLVPAREKAAIKGVCGHVVTPGAGARRLQRLNETRNPLAFGHAGRNLAAV